MEFIDKIKIKDIHIGSIIEEKFEKSKLSKTKFASMIGRTRTDVNDIFTRKTIDTELLIAISIALNYDFILNVYYEGQTSSPTIYIALKITENEIKGIDLPEEFTHFIKVEKESVNFFDENRQKN